MTVVTVQERLDYGSLQEVASQLVSTTVGP